MRWFAEKPVPPLYNWMSCTTNVLRFSDTFAGCVLASVTFNYYCYKCDNVCSPKVPEKCVRASARRIRGASLLLVHTAYT